MRKRVLWCVLIAAIATAGYSQFACEEAAKALENAATNDGVFCLDDVLELAGTSREELGPAADAVVREALAAQKDVIGKSYVIDCVARDQMTTADISDGENVVAQGAEDVPDRVQDIDEDRGGDGEDVAILLDATGSMGDDKEEVAANIEDIMDSVRERGGRLAVAIYRDNFNCDGDAWYDANGSGLVPLDDADGADEIADFLDAVTVGGGCDWPESLYDAVVETAERLDWESDGERMITAITDAEALTGAATQHTAAQVSDVLSENDITLHTILVGVAY